MPMLNVQYPDLQTMFGQNSLYNTLYGMQRFDQAQQNEQQNMDQAKQDMQFQADQHPLDLQRIQSENQLRNAQTDSTRAGIPGQVAEGRLKTADADIQTSPEMLEQRRQAAIAHLGSQMSDDDFNKASNMVQGALLKNPKDPQALASFDMLMKVREWRERNATQLESARIMADGRVNAAEARQPTAKSPNPPSTFQALAARAMLAAQEAMAKGDSQEAARQMEIARDASQRDYEARRASATAVKPGTIDVPGVADLPAVPPPSNPYDRGSPTPTPQPIPTPQPSPARNSLDQDKVTIRLKSGAVLTVPRAALAHAPDGFQIVK